MDHATALLVIGIAVTLVSINLRLGEIARRKRRERKDEES